MMKSIRFTSGNIRLLVILILVAFTTDLCLGQSKDQQLDQLLGLYHEYGQFNGSVLVADGGKVVYTKGFGMANMEWDIPNQADTKHRLGSITKQFTAMLILQLVAEGKLDLQAPITTYLPDYPKASGEQITTHHLLTHTSGIPNYTADPDFFANESRNPSTPDEFVKKFSDKDLEFTPGENFNYSNSGYFLLGVLLEKITGKTYEELLQDKILKPLKMHDTGYDHHAAIIERRATGYEKRGNNYVNASYLDMSLPYAAGSMYSTVEDLYLWDQALYTDQLLPKKYMDLYFKPHMPAFGQHYAYGWIVGKEGIGNSADSIEVMSHGGGINGFNTIISRAPANQSLVVLLNNTGGAPLNQITRAIRGIMSGKTYDMPKKSLAYTLMEVIEQEGIDAGLTYYQAHQNDKNFNLSENEMNQVGYQFMRSDQLEEALQVFKLNIEAFPESYNVYDSYAEALMNLGKNELAIENYKKSVVMNPANQNGIDMLGKLGEDTSDLQPEIKVPEAMMETYVGKYELMPNFILTVSKDGEQMKAQATGQPAFDIFPKSERVFYLKAVAAQLTFNEGKDGQIESVTLLQGGQEITGKKLTP